MGSAPNSRCLGGGRRHYDGCPIACGGGGEAIAVHDGGVVVERTRGRGAAVSIDGSSVVVSGREDKLTAGGCSAAVAIDGGVASVVPTPTADLAPTPDRVARGGASSVGKSTQPSSSPGIASSAPRTTAREPPRQSSTEPPRQPSTDPPRPPGTLVITASPFAEVAVDGRPRGTTPLSLDLSPKLYRVTLTGPDGEVKTQTVEVVSAHETKISHKWNQP